MSNDAAPAANAVAGPRRAELRLSAHVSALGHDDIPKIFAASASTTTGAIGDAAPSSGLLKSQEAGVTKESGGGSAATHEETREAAATSGLAKYQEAGMKRGPGAAASAAETEPGSASSGGLGRAEAVPSPAAGAGVAFSSQHLADVLCAAFSTMQAMKGCLQTVQSKSEAFKAVKRSSRADGQYSKEQIAASISKCRPVSVTNAQELLSWLKVRAIEYECE